MGSRLGHIALVSPSVSVDRVLQNPAYSWQTRLRCRRETVRPVDCLALYHAAVCRPDSGSCVRSFERMQLRATVRAPMADRSRLLHSVGLLYCAGRFTCQEHVFSLNRHLSNPATFGSCSAPSSQGTRSGQNAWRKLSAGCPGLAFASMHARLTAIKSGNAS